MSPNIAEKRHDYGAQNDYDYCTGRCEGRPLTSAHKLRVAASILAPAILFASHSAVADENGISFWVPGFFGSLAATPQQPGWSLANIYYHTSVSAGADVARAREFSLGRVPGNVTVNANLSTPPLNTPIDTTRRGFLGGTAAALAAGTAVNVAALATTRPAAAASDPILAVIEAHKAAWAAEEEAKKRFSAFEEELADN